MANPIVRLRTTWAVLALAFAVIVLGQSLSGQATPGCIRVQGVWLDALNTVGGSSGVVTRAGILNGTTETVYNPAFVFTPDSNVVSYIAETAFTTNHGTLATNNVYLYNFVTGLGTVMATVSPEESSGQFAGATGTLYFNTTETIGLPPNQSYTSTIAGEVCSL
jgi:hypothetical protein